MRKQSKTLGDWRSIKISDKDKPYLGKFILSYNTKIIETLKSGACQEAHIEEMPLFLLAKNIIELLVNQMLQFQETFNSN